jgi:CHAD domain-containing protein
MEERHEDTFHNHARIADELAKRAGAAPPANEWNKVRKLAQRHLNRFISLEPKVLKGDDPDAIHDMRVASRRLQQILDLIFPKPLPHEVGRLRRKLRRCRRTLGDVRNCDVMLKHVEGRLARRRSSDQEAWAAVKQYLLERRSDSFARATRKLSKMNLALFYLHAKEILGRVKPSPETGGVSHSLALPDGAAFEPFPERLTQALVGVWSDFEKQVAVSRQEATPPSIHAARICAKRLRYLLEVVNQFGIPGSAGALAWLKKIQQCLGDWHDTEVLEQMMIEMIAKPTFLRDQLPLALAIGKLILRNRVTKQRFRDKYFQMTLASTDYEGIKSWVQGLLAVPDSGNA